MGHIKKKKEKKDTKRQPQKKVWAACRGVCNNGLGPPTGPFVVGEAFGAFVMLRIPLLVLGHWAKPAWGGRRGARLGLCWRRTGAGVFNGV